ncbi:MAG: hypothetical protein GC159_17250 [Phycisphaera sp.]|nr:hypothetical protein [Phycisphaera sp.]
MTTVPNEPYRRPSFGFLYLPPYRVQGYSIAGEETFVQVPELDVCFDIGRAPRLALTSNHVALTHGHMDHAAGLAYYFSQRNFQGMGVGTVLCHPLLVDAINKVMTAWIDVERQRTPYKLVAMQPGDEVELKNHIFLRAFKTDHSDESLGFVVVEKRSKLKDAYAMYPQEKLVELKKAGEEITYTREIPLIAYMGDTGPGDHFAREDVANARILITECTFLEQGHRSRARAGKHLHLLDLAEILPNMKAKHVVLTHLSRRTHLGQAREALDAVLTAEQQARIHILMDYRTNRARYKQQVADAEGTSTPPPPEPSEAQA